MNKKLLALTLLVLVTAVTWYLKTPKITYPTTAAGYAATTVMITNFERTSGGTGVVYRSTKTESKVLTNKHVCQLLVHGGLVITDNVTTTASYYQTSETHDECLVTVNANLGVNTEVSEETQPLYSSNFVSGHPNLLPTIVTTGFFSHKEIVTVMSGIRPCTKDDFESPNAILCLFLGGIPIIKQYESQVISATIMPGSSGSAVFNEKGEIAGLVFAGSGNLSYGIIVPSEYVYNFLHSEVKTLRKNYPTPASATFNTESKAGLKEACSALEAGNKTYEPVRKYCKYITKDDLIYGI